MQRAKKSRWQRFWQYLRKEARWLTPGLGVKRWLLLILAGNTLLGVGLAMLSLDVYRTAPDTWWLPALSLRRVRWLFCRVFGQLPEFASRRPDRALRTPSGRYRFGSLRR